MAKKLTKNDKALLEAIQLLFEEPTNFGVPETETSLKGLEYLHNHINQLYDLKVADSPYSLAIRSSFSKVHSYKYIDDPTFKTALKKELVAQAVPSSECDKAEKAVDDVVKELKNDMDITAEKDYGFNKNIDEVVAMPENPDNEFEVIDNNLNDDNLEPEEDYPGEKD